jgi:hypothetical protein
LFFVVAIIIIIINSGSDNINRRDTAIKKQVLNQKSDSGNLMLARYPLLVDGHEQWHQKMH